VFFLWDDVIWAWNLKRNWNGRVISNGVVDASMEMLSYTGCQFIPEVTVNCQEWFKGEILLARN
jgi:hypothetical protein